MRKLLLIFIFWSVTLLQLHAGWIIKERSGMGKKHAWTVRTYYYQDQQLKLVEKGLVSIFKLKTGKITFILPDKEIYWQGDAQSYNREFEEILKKAFEKKADSLNDVESEMARATLSYYLAVMNDSTRSDQPLLDMVLMNSGKTDKIAGHKVTMYGLYVNKILKEEFWVAESVQVNNEFNMNRFNDLLQSIGNGLAGDLNEEANRVFEELLKKGYLMKTVEYDYANKSVTEVKTVKKKTLNNSVFLVPEKYKKVGLEELGLN